VTVRITVEETARRRVVRVDGRLTAAEVSDLENALGDDPALAEINLRDLRSVDADGLAALRRMRAAGFALRETPPRIRFEIEGEDD
jgi:anti-sigma factor RsiW